MSFSSGPHILIIPYPTQGHIIPLLNLTRKLLAHNLNVTVLVTPSHLQVLEPLLLSHPHSLYPLVLSPPFYSVRRGPVTTTRAFSQLSGPISDWFRSHPSPPVAIISDMFLGWTQDLASDLGILRIVFWSLGAYATSIFNYLWHDMPKPEHRTDLESILILNKVPGCPKYPWGHISDLYRDFKIGDPDWEFFKETLLANDRSWGVVFNSFTNLEGVYINHFKKEIGHDRVWAVGPLVPSDDGLTRMTGELRNWLDSKMDEEVVYICFGSLWTLTKDQLTILATALESSGVNFIWVLKETDLKNLSENGGSIFNGFEDRVRGRGFLLKEWSPQVEILGHKSVGSFVTHCGWNSVLEGLVAGVLLLTWPLLADQFYNAKFLVEEIGIASRFCEGGEVIPESSELARLLIESVSNKFRLEERVRIKELQKVAAGVLKEGSLGGDLEAFVQQLSKV